MSIELSVRGLLILLGIPTAVTAFCSWLLQRRITKRDAALDKREAAREKNGVLLIRSTGAAIALGEATAEALKNGHCNGEMEAALEYARKVKHEQKDFLTEQGVAALY